MSQGNDFANYASSAEERSAASEDVWFVAVSSDDIKQMSVDQLDEAFRLGVITAQTAVWTEGMEAWAPLGEVADLDADGDASESEVAAAPSAPSFGASAFDDAPRFDAPSPALPQPQRSQPQSSHPQSSNGESVPSQRRTNPGWQNPFDAPAARSFSGAASNSLSTSSMGPSSFAPVTASYAPGSSLGHSTGPVALNVDEDMPPVSRGRRFRPERWLLAAAGVIAVGVIGFNNADLLSSKSMAAAEKQASAAALVARPYEVSPDKSGAAKSAAVLEKADQDDGKDAPIGTLKGEGGEEEASEGAAPGDPVTKLAGAKEAASKDSAAKDSATKDSATKDSATKDSAAKDSAAKDSASKESLRGGFAKAFSKTAPATKSAKGAKPGKPARAAKVAHKTTRRAPAKPKKGGVVRAASAFDPLNGSLP